MKERPLLSDIEELRRRARKRIESGAVTERYQADRETAIKLLDPIAQECLQHANERAGTR